MRTNITRTMSMSDDALKRRVLRRHRRQDCHNHQIDPSRRGPASTTSPSVVKPRPVTFRIERVRRLLLDGTSADPRHLGKQIKWEEQDGRTRLSAVSHEQSSQELYFRPPSQQQQDQWNENQRLVIRIAHRASKQESKFTTKSSTRVSKVVSGACKSFGLDAKQAALYLIVDIEDEDEMTENFFLCHMDDTMARAGAEHDTESRFLLTIAGDP
ncbi:hypothetical protein F5I97DRAFT_1904218 [Phlebopus sp. FC_14]|nr:hypothetical protein F5I97DRAFT_1904218 [Phlebopus sp. FC_14]